MLIKQKQMLRLYVQYVCKYQDKNEIVLVVMCGMIESTIWQISALNLLLSGHLGT